MSYGPLHYIEIDELGRLTVLAPSEYRTITDPARIGRCFPVTCDLLEDWSYKIDHPAHEEGDA